MALAVTHVLGAIFILDILRHYVFGKDKFPRYLLVIGGIAGLAPDIDFPLGWFVSLIQGTSVHYHGEFTHSLLIAGIILFMGVVRHYQDDDKWAKIFYVIAAGWFIHISLDCLFNSYETFLWPLGIQTKAFCPQKLAGFYRSGIDAIILVVWLIHEEVHNKIKDYF